MVKYSDELLGGEHLDEVFRALADPTRRALLARLRGEEASVGELAEPFPVSLAAVSKHLKVLERAGLVEREVRGRQHRMSLNAEPLRDATEWIAHYRAFWDERLDALEAHLSGEVHSSGEARVDGDADRNREEERS